MPRKRKLRRDEEIGDNPYGIHLPIWRHCSYCGLWKNGPFKGRRDVPFDELAAVMRSRGAEPHPGGEAASYKPAIYEPEHVQYTGGETPSIVSHGGCDHCHPRHAREQQERLARIQARLQPPAPEPAAEPEPDEAAKRLSGGAEDEEQKP